MILHDLNNPISTVHCCCEVIARESSDPALLEATSLLDHAAQAMRGMTQELLDFTRGSTFLRKEKTTTGQLFAALSKQWRPLLQPYQVELVTEMSADAELEVDVGRLLRLFGNLVKNARQAMPTGGTVTLAAECAPNEIVFRVSDTGVGIPAELLPQILEPFVTHGKSNGTGLGMAIARSVVEAHGGKINVRSKIAHGTTIEIRLPSGDAEPESEG
jgi:signal transduction histidine kinase